MVPGVMEAEDGVTLTVVRTGDAVARAVAMAATWAEVRLLRLLLPMPPMLLLMAVWIWVALLPFLVEEARGLWQLAQLVPYRAAPSGGVAIAVTVMADVAVLVVVPLVAVAVMVAVPADYTRDETCGSINCRHRAVVGGPGYGRADKGSAVLIER